MLASCHICFHQERYRVIKARQLRCLPDLFLIGLLGSFDDGAPDLVREGLVGTGRAANSLRIQSPVIL